MSKWCEDPLCTREHYVGQGTCHTACTDQMCPTYRAMIPHVSDEAHRLMLHELDRIERQPEPSTPRSLILRAEDMRRERWIRVLRTVSLWSFVVGFLAWSVTIVLVFMGWE